MALKRKTPINNNEPQRESIVRFSNSNPTKYFKRNSILNFKPNLTKTPFKSSVFAKQTQRKPRNNISLMNPALFKRDPPNIELSMAHEAHAKKRANNLNLTTNEPQLRPRVAERVAVMEQRWQQQQELARAAAVEQMRQQEALMRAAAMKQQEELARAAANPASQSLVNLSHRIAALPSLPQNPFRFNASKGFTPGSTPRVLKRGTPINPSKGGKRRTKRRHNKKRHTKRRR